MEEDEAGPVQSSGTFVAWPEISKFSTMLLHLEEAAKFGDDAEALASLSKTEGIEYRGKIKLHGTNSGVTIMEGEAVPQSRTRSLIDGDNEGFAKWVRSCADYFGKYLVDLKDALHANRMVLFGEWCGSGIMKGAAICRVPQRYFCIFGLCVDDNLIIEPEAIKDHVLRFTPLGGAEGGGASAVGSVPANLIVLPWLTDIHCLKIKEPDSLNEEIAKMNKLVEDVDNEDPWVKKTFDISGPGEGIVWYPVGMVKEGGKISMSLYGKLVFKAKGEKHLVVKQKAPIQRTVEVPQGVDEFVEMFVTPGRLDQGLREASEGKFNPRLIGPFINWIANDVEKESKVELNKANLIFGQVRGPVINKARTWYMAQLPKDKH